MNVQEQVVDIFREEFENDRLEINEKTNSNDIKHWDSLANINLIVAMEKTFSVKFVTEEIDALQNVGDMIRLIEKKLN